MKFCRYCGSEIKEGMRFCKKCGRSLEEIPYAGSSGQKPSTGGNNKNSGNKTLLIVLIVFLIMLLIGAGVGALLYFKTQDKSTGTETVAKQEETIKEVKEEKGGKGKTEESESESSAYKDDPAEMTYEYAVETLAPETKAAETADTPKVFVGSSVPTNNWKDISVTLDYLENARISNYNRVDVPDYAVSESSSINQEGIDNHAFKAFDGDIKTNWQEGVDGDGIGEYIEVRFPEYVAVDMITIAPGNQKTIDWFYKNNIPCNITVVVNDEYGFPISLPVDIETFAVQFSQQLTVDSLKFVIDAVYKGTDYDDTVITDIGIYTKK